MLSVSDENYCSIDDLFDLCYDSHIVFSLLVPIVLAEYSCFMFIWFLGTY